jgi:PAS domain-containing protein
MGVKARRIRAWLFGASITALLSAVIAFTSVPAVSVACMVLFLVCGIAAWRGLPEASSEALKDSTMELAEARGQFKQVVENLPVGLFTLKDGNFTFSNWAWDEQVLRMPGQSPTLSFRRSLVPEDRERVLDLLQRYEAREEPFTMRFRLGDDLGEFRHIESHGVPVYGANGTFQHMLGFNLDISSAERATYELDSKNQALEHAFRDLEDNLEAMLASLVKAIEAKDPYTAGHSERVMEFSVRIGQALGLSEEDLHVLRMGTLIHDIGKIGVPDSVLTKPDKLTDEEFEIIKRHPVTGFNMIRDIPYFKACAPIVRWHHERLNGRGYPDGLRGDEIPLLVQISTVADMFDAMTSNRAYRRSLGIEVAVSELRKDVKNNVVNGDLVELWIGLLREDGLLDADSQASDLPMAA